MKTFLVTSSEGVTHVTGVLKENEVAAVANARGLTTNVTVKELK